VVKEKDEDIHPDFELFVAADLMITMKKPITTTTTMAIVDLVYNNVNGYCCVFCMQISLYCISQFHRNNQTVKGLFWMPKIPPIQNLHFVRFIQ